MPHNETIGAQFFIELRHLYQDVARITERELGMSQTRMEILHELFHAGEMSQADLQRHLGVEGPVITRIVKQLEATGFVTRRPDPRDNRYTLVALSPMARQGPSSSEGERFKGGLGDQLLAGLNEEEKAQLLRMIRHVRENAETMRKAKHSLLPPQEEAGDQH